MNDLRQIVINFLAARPRTTPGLIAAHIGERVADVQGVLNALASEGLVKMSFPAGALQPACELVKPETIGECETCGVLDHHLVDGICPTCRPKCATVSAGGERGFVAVAREFVTEVVAGAKLAAHNLCGPDDEEDRIPDSGYRIQEMSADVPGKKLIGQTGVVIIDEVPEDALGAEADVSHVLAVQRLREIESDPETRKRLDNFRLDTDRR